ncbi:MAG: HD domain-containing protein [Owenweeksia sp.]|nr:HD domain-containing protein [Owenweeksia sp.]
MFVHNRLTHSLEAVSVGRSLGQIVGEHLADDQEIKAKAITADFYRNQLKNVISAACLAHDLGNPAFGHSGEEAISKYFRDQSGSLKNKFNDKQWQDLIRFEGNANALRVLTHQFNGRLKGGYQLTYPTLASILKYPSNLLLQIKNKASTAPSMVFFNRTRTPFSILPPMYI